MKNYKSKLVLGDEDGFWQSLLRILLRLQPTRDIDFKSENFKIQILSWANMDAKDFLLFWSVGRWSIKISEAMFRPWGGLSNEYSEEFLKNDGFAPPRSVGSTFFRVIRTSVMFYLGLSYSLLDCCCKSDVKLGRIE